MLETATSFDLKAAFDEQFVKSINELIDRFRELESTEVSAIPEKKEDIAAATQKLAELQQQISEAQARYDIEQERDVTRKALLERLSQRVIEFSRPVMREKLTADGIRVVRDETKAEIDALSALDERPLLARPDYRDVVAAADETLDKIAALKAEIVKTFELSNGLKTLRDKIDQRGRNFLDAATSTELASLAKSVKVLDAAKVPLTPELRVQLSDANAGLGQLEHTADKVMDREEKLFLARTLPGRNGAWQFKFEVDKITDEERAQAITQAEGLQAKYQLMLICRGRDAELLVSTFEIGGTVGKQIPWNDDGQGPYQKIRLRVDSNPVFATRIRMRGYENRGQVDLTGEFMSIARSSRFVFADIFPDEQVEVVTAFPSQFIRLCELMASGQPEPVDSDGAARNSKLDGARSAVDGARSEQQQPRKPKGSRVFANIDDLIKTDQAFLQAEVMLRPGISDLPGESVRKFLERFLRTQMDNGQRAQIIRIVKQDNEYTVDLQLKNRTALLFRHILSAPVNGRAAMLQSVIFTVAFSQGRKVDPPYEQAIDPLEFVTFMSGVPGFIEAPELPDDIKVPQPASPPTSPEIKTFPHLRFPEGCVLWNAEHNFCRKYDQ